jgi:hypothetical protein
VTASRWSFGGNGVAPAVVLVLVLLGARGARADDGMLGLRMQASATTVKQGDTFRLDVVLTVRGQDAVDEIEGPDLTDFEVVGQSESSNASFTLNGGRRSVVVEHRRAYMLRATTPGTHQVGDVTARLDGNVARAAPIAIRVIGNRNTSPAAAHDDQDPTGQGTEDPGGGAVVVPAAREPGARFRGRDLPDIFLDVRPDKDTVIVGQQVGVVVEVWSQVPLGQYPRVPGPKPPGFICLSLSDGTTLSATQRTLRGRTWFVYPLARDALFPLSPGRKQIPTVTVDVTPAGSFFRRNADVRLASESVALEVQPLPDGAPPGFSPGNVGLWDLRVTARPARVSAGEPFTLVIEAVGVGNVDSVEPPTWSGTPDVRLFPPTVRRERNDRDGVVAGRVVVETLVQPAEPGTVRIPSLSMATFSPDEGRFVTRTAPPVEVVVAPVQGRRGVAPPATSASSTRRRVDVGRGPRPLALDIVPRGARIDDEGFVAFGGAIGLLAIVAGVALGARRRSVGSAAGRARRHRLERAAALVVAQQGGDLATAHRLLLDALAQRCGGDLRAVDSSRWEELLPARGLPPALAGRVVAAVRAVEAARYAPGGAQQAALDAVVAAAQALDAEPGRETPEAP